ncbi:hypothetical protein [Ancylomarina sp. 16SWW S1-10-2]|uniref:hypothetical protein n=1 Tax=Ancylomarina sp. 16SWW S1-10-2 TaxID=2499681 RepID=UPI0012AD9839|nr:hypothetical protein [Ancylomarina sp. 16SWW S1-10-2]MRT94567.1 hypothetical protein [Ancylomarina sp. 16SWW S1-10-2]
MKSVLSFICLMILSSVSYSQYYSTGQDPSNIKWKQINTADFRIVFPATYEAKARYVAALFHDLKEKGGKDLNHSPKKFSVILHTQSATSNGMVAWAPKRIELYATPPQDDDTQAWLDHLVSHEYRHVLQMDKLERGLTRILNVILGQQATALIAGLYLPSWFMEGDAVCTETALGESGRGRSAEFEQELKAQLLQKGAYSYDKAAMGSYKDFVPNKYTLGYYLVGKSRVHYGDKFWDNTLNKIGGSPLNINCMSTGLKNGMKDKRSVLFNELKEKQNAYLNTNYRIERVDWNEVEKLNKHRNGKLTFYADVMSELKWDWKNQDTNNKRTQAKSLVKEKAIYTNYNYPHIANKGLLLMKEGLADAMSFVELDENGVEKEIFVPGYDYGTGFDYKNNKLLWSEYQADLRWEHGDKAIIVTYDMQTQTKRKYKLAHNCFAPVFSEDGKQILSVEVDSDGESTLLILDTETASIIKRIAAKKGEFFMTPQWAKNDKSIVVISQANGEKSLLELDLETESRTLLYAADKTNISQPYVSDDYVFFTSSHTGINNIFAYEWENGQISQLTSSRFGAKDPFYYQSKNTLYYSDYSADGYVPINLDLASGLWKRQDGEQAEFKLAEQLSNQLGEKMQADTSKLDQWQVKPYSRLAHTFQFHSWAPLFVSPDEENIDIGISASSQNLLNTFFTTVGYKKEEGYDKGQFYLNLSYERFFPIFNSKLEYGKNSRNFNSQIRSREDDTVIGVLNDLEWNQLEWKNSISLPFNLSSGKHATVLKPKFSYNIYKWTGYHANISSSTQTLSASKLGFTDRTFKELEYQVYFSHSIKSSQRDLQSRWAQYLQFDYRYSPTKNNTVGEVWSGIGQFNLPGFAKHHGISVYAGYQNRSKLNTSFGNAIKSPRGVSNLLGLDCATTSLDYRMPLAYPDWNLGGLAYIKRVKMGAFIDYGMEKGEYTFEENLYNFDNRITSIGLEFTADMHVLRLPIPLNLGFRLGYENETNAVFGDVLLSYSLSF